MSEELIKSLQRRVNELESDNINLKAEAKDRRLKAKKLTEENESLKGTVTTLTGERDSFKAKAESSNPELTAKVAELEGVIRTRNHKSAFATKARDAGVRPEAVEDLWTLSGYKAEGEEPDPAAIDAAIAGAKTNRPYLFTEPEATAKDGDDRADLAGKTETKPPDKLKVSLDNGRGGGNLGANAFKVTKAQLQDPSWMMANGVKIHEAQKAGNFVLAD